MVPSSWQVLYDVSLQPFANPVCKPLQLHLERLHNGRYKISSRNAPTADINKLLYALLINKEKAEEWHIHKRGVADHRILYT
jgi:hypothetical protein